MNAVDVVGLKKSYILTRGFFLRKIKAIEALKGIFFSVKKGEVFGLLGPNGAGKSTIINILSGILLRDAGTITIFGKDYDAEKEQIRMSMNVCSGHSRLISSLTVYENLKVFGKLYNVKNITSRIDELLTTFSILAVKHRVMRSLSSGQKTRVGLCKGFLNTPQLLL